MIIYFHAMVILSAILSGVFLLSWNRTIAVHFPMIFLLMPIINIGYLKVATSQDINEALLANGIVYFDGCFLELVFFLYIMNFCKLKVPKLLTAGLLASGVTVFYFAINDSRLHMLYTSAELKRLDGVSYIVKEYGVVHTFYYILIGLYLAANLAAIIYSFTRKNVSKINSALLLTIYLMIIAAFLTGKMFHPAFELLPLSYTLSQVIFLIVMRKINLYDVTSSAVADISEKGGIGFAAFDLKMRYLGCTKYAENCLPELGTLYIDKTLTPKNEIFAKIADCINELKKGGSSPSFYVSRGDITYKVTAGHVFSGERIRGYRLRTEDNTIEARELEALKLKERQKEMETEILRLEKSASEAANRAKSTFLAQMSHEIRTPINAVLGMNEMILRESTDPDITEYAENIRGAGRTLLSLINSILDFSKIEDGKMELIPVNYSTAALISDPVNSISNRAAEKGLELIVNADESLPAVLRGDDVRLKQIIMNLLTNAVKYTSSGTVTLTVGRSGGHDDVIGLSVEVRDTGIGIKEEDMGALFESFRRLDEKRNRNIEGTGLGMAIITKLLGMMGSELSVESVYGEGSAFRFVVEQQVINSEPMGKHRLAEVSADSENGGSYRLYAPNAAVLVVDDNTMNLKVARNFLRLFGIAADTADSGEAVPDMLTEKHYDMIFLDHMMPKKDGIEVLHEIKERGLVDEGTKIIVLTANAIVGEREKYLSEGFDGYLTKPIDNCELETMLETYLPEDKKQLAAAERRPQNERNCDDDDDTLSFEEIVKIRELCPELNAAAGMGYCMDSRGFWLGTLEGFADADRSEELCGAFDCRDIELYRITVHGIKSAARTIGAEVIAEYAQLLEFAARDGKTELIEREHEGFVRRYRELIGNIRKVTENEQDNIH